MGSPESVERTKDFIAKIKGHAIKIVNQRASDESVYQHYYMWELRTAGETFAAWFADLMKRFELTDDEGEKATIAREFTEAVDDGYAFGMFENGDGLVGMLDECRVALETCKSDNVLLVTERDSLKQRLAELERFQERNK